MGQELFTAIDSDGSPQLGPERPTRRSWVDWLRPVLPQSATARIWLALLAFAWVWLGMLDVSSLSAPVDNIEQLTWVRSLEWGYYKHPPLPTWLLWPVVKLLGLRPDATYWLGACVTLASLGLMTHWLTRMRGARFALLALLAVLCITFYNGRLYYYNHNTVMFMFVVGSAWASWQAFRLRSLNWWALVGLMLGLGGLSKYQIAVAAVSVAVVWIQQRAWRDSVHRRGAALAVVTALLVMAPHLAWLMRNDFAPIHYAMNSSLGVDMSWSKRPAEAAHWLLDLVFNRELPAWLLLSYALASSGRSGRRAAALEPRHDSADPTQLSRASLLSFGLVPLTMMPAMGLLAGVDLQLQWGTAFAAFTVPAVLELLSMRGMVFSKQALPRAFNAFLVLQLILIGVNLLTSPLGPQSLESKHWCRFDSVGLARAIAGPSSEDAGGPIHIIEGPARVAGALALQLPGHPLVLIDGNPAISPWVSKEALRLCTRLQLDVAVGPHDQSWLAVGPQFPDIFWRVIIPGDSDRPCPA